MDRRSASIRSFAFPVLLAVGAAIIGPPTWLQSVQAREYRIATVAWAGWSPLHVADETGIWRDLDVAVRVIDYDDPIVIVEAIKAGRIDFAMDMAGSVVGIRMRGEPVVILAETNWSHGGDKIIVHAGRTVHDAVGAPLGVFLNLPSCLFFLGRYLATQGLGLNDFRIVEINPRDLTAQFIAGRLPVIVNYEPWATRAVAQGSGVVVADSAMFEGCIPECIWAYRDRLRRVPAEDLQAILHGWVAAVEWIAQPDNQPVYRTILAQRTFKHVEHVSAANVTRMLADVRIHSPAQLRQRNCDGGGLQAYLTALKTFLRANGLLESDFSVAELFDNGPIMTVLRDRAPPHAD